MIFMHSHIFKGQKNTPVMSKRTFVIDLGEDRILLFHKERWIKKDEDAGFQLHFI